MTGTAKTSAHVIHTSVSQQTKISVSQESSSSAQETEMQSPFFQPTTSQAQFVPPTFMPYIEGPKMDWTVNGGLYHRFLKWKLKCENMSDYELAMLPMSKKCKKVMFGVMMLGWISMFPGACTQMTSAWIYYGPSIKIFANLT